MDIVADHNIIKSVLFENGRGFALGKRPDSTNAATWQFAEENGKRDYCWGHYYSEENHAIEDFAKRVTVYQQRFMLKIVRARPHDAVPVRYQYYSTQRPVDSGTYPNPAGNEPVEFFNYDERLPVEGGSFLAWGWLLYAEPLTGTQMREYELKPSPTNPDQVKQDSSTKDNAAKNTRKNPHRPDHGER